MTYYRIFSTVILLAAFLYSVYVDVLLWRWYVVPLGAPEVGYAHMAGLSLTVLSIAGITGLGRSLFEILERIETLERTIAPVDVEIRGDRLVGRSVFVLVAVSASHLMGWLVHLAM